jgi:hypothetical protein
VPDATDPTDDDVIPEAAAADVAEQQAEVDPVGGIDVTALTDDPEVPEADNLEQAQEVEGALDDDDDQ